MIKGEGYFIATGVTKGEILDGVSFSNGLYETHSIVLSTRNHEMQMITSTIVAQMVFLVLINAIFYTLKVIPQININKNN